MSHAKAVNVFLHFMDVFKFTYINLDYHVTLVGDKVFFKYLGNTKFILMNYRYINMNS